MTLRNDQDVNYLTSKLETDSLNKDGIQLVASSNVVVPSQASRIPTLFSTGSSVNYLAGEYLIPSTLASGSIIATLPANRGARKGSRYIAISRDAPSPVVFVALAFDGLIITNIDEIAVGTVVSLSFDGIVYLSE